jgi:hypothetical protein
VRCYFMREGHIENVELLRDGPDESLIEQAKRLFKEYNTDHRYDGFEIWSGKRFVYREPPD